MFSARLSVPGCTDSFPLILIMSRALIRLLSRGRCFRMLISLKMLPVELSPSISSKRSCKARRSSAAADVGDKATTLDASRYLLRTLSGMSILGSSTGHERGCTISSLCHTATSLQFSHFENSQSENALSVMHSPKNERRVSPVFSSCSSCAEDACEFPYHICLAVTSQYGQVKTSRRSCGVTCFGIIRESLPLDRIVRSFLFYGRRGFHLVLHRPNLAF